MSQLPFPPLDPPTGMIPNNTPTMPLFPVANTSTNTPVVISSRQVVKQFPGVTALAGVSLDIPLGQLVAVMGPSGSGKSTLIHCLSGILVPDSGSVSFNGNPLSVLKDSQRATVRRHNFGFIYQDGQLLEELNVLENIALPLIMNSMPKRQAYDQARVWAERIGVTELLKRRLDQISGGQAQRVAIARALVHSPSVIFADEPTGALDQATGHLMMQVLTTACRKSNATLIMVTHDANVAAWCDRLVEIRDGLVFKDRITNQGNR